MIHHIVRSLLDKLTMYRATMAAVVAIVVIAIFASLLDLTGYAAWQIIGSLVLISGSGLIANLALAKLFNVPANIESSAITHMILVLIMPPFDGTMWLGIALAATSILAAASKYLVVFKSRHIFNPAAFAAFASVILFGIGASWWVATPALLPFVALFGILLLYKIQRLRMAVVFTVVAVISIYATNLIGGIAPDPWWSLAQLILLSYPLVFFASFMLSEPMTSPGSSRNRLYFAVIVGVLFGASFHFGPISASPELALLVGNAFAFAVSSKGRVRLRLHGSRVESDSLTHYDFVPSRSFSFVPGQYVDMNIDMPLTAVDSRGTRRYFTLASAPHEQHVSFGVRTSDTPSGFKKKLAQMKPGDELVIGAPAGDFVLPADTHAKLLMLAGGVGITPFRSMISHMIAARDTRQSDLIYSAATSRDIAYDDLFREAHMQTGLRTHRRTDKDSRLDAATMTKLVPDLADRIVYISGPNAYVDAMKKIVRQAGVARSRIKTDYFPGI